MPTKPRPWGKLLLAGGLLVILAQGVIYIPALRGRLFPGVFCQEKLLKARFAGARIENNLEALKANLEALDGLSPGGSSPAGTDSGGTFPLNPFFRLVRFKGGDPAKNSSERHWYLARKNLFQAEWRLKFLEAISENFALAAASPGHGALGFPDWNFSLAREEINTLRQKCQEYRSELNILSQRLQNLERKVQD